MWESYFNGTQFSLYFIIIWQVPYRDALRTAPCQDRSRGQWHFLRVRTKAESSVSFIRYDFVIVRLTLESTRSFTPHSFAVCFETWDDEVCGCLQYLHDHDSILQQAWSNRFQSAFSISSQQKSVQMHFIFLVQQMKTE